WNVADRDRVLAISQTQDECACRAVLRSSFAVAFDGDGRWCGLRTFDNHMPRDEDILRKGNRETGHVFVTNRNLRLGPKSQVHDVVAWKDLRECKCAIGADRRFESGAEISPGRFP